MPEAQHGSVAADTRRQADAQPVGLTFCAADRIADVVEAWRLVYTSWLRAGRIEPNLARIYTAPQAVHPDTAVIVGKISGLMVATITAVVDGPYGLPLDDVCRAQTDGLRSRDCRLVEIGLFGDRREHVGRSLPALLDLTRHAFFYALHAEATDILIGVRPDHAVFFQRCFAFEPLCPSTPGAAVDPGPMVPLRLNVQREFGREQLPKGLEYLRRHPLEPDFFRDRLRLSEALIAGTPIERFLKLRQQPSATPAAHDDQTQSDAAA